MEPGLWPVAPQPIWKLGRAPVRREAPEKIFRDGQYSLLFAVHGALWSRRLGATVCGYALGGSDKSLTLAALTWLFLSGLPRTLVLCFNPLSPPHFLKTHQICINLKTGPGAGWGGAVAPRDDANEKNTKLNKLKQLMQNGHKLTLIWSYSYDPRSGNEVVLSGTIACRFVIRLRLVLGTGFSVQLVGGHCHLYIRYWRVFKIGRISVQKNDRSLLSLGLSEWQRKVATTMQ